MPTHKTKMLRHVFINRDHNDYSAGAVTVLEGLRKDAHDFSARRSEQSMERGAVAVCALSPEVNDRRHDVVSTWRQLNFNQIKVGTQ